MVLLDDVGWMDVGFHDNNFHTPNIDELVAEGIELTTFYTSPLCTPARSQLMTGIYNYKTGMQDFLIEKTEPRGVPLNHKFLPEKLLDAGYQTRMVGKWHLGFHMNAYTPMSRGFERFYGIYSPEGDHFSHLLARYVWLDVFRRKVDPLVNGSTLRMDLGVPYELLYAQVDGGRCSAPSDSRV